MATKYFFLCTVLLRSEGVQVDIPNGREWSGANVFVMGVISPDFQIFNNFIWILKILIYWENMSIGTSRPNKRKNIKTAVWKKIKTLTRLSWI